MSEVTANISLTPISATFIVDNNNINLTPEATQLTIINGYAGISGFSGYSGTSGAPGAASGYSGKSGYSGRSGDPGGTSGWSGRSGYSGAAFVGSSGYSGWSGTSGVSVIVGGSNTQVQFNDVGILSGSSGFTFDKISNVANFPGNVNITGNSAITGNVSVTGATIIRSGIEKLTINGTAATSTVNYDFITQAIIYNTAAANTNVVLNFRGNSSITANSYLSTGDSIVSTYLLTTTTPYSITGVSIDSVTQTINWVNGYITTPQSSSITSYTFTMIKTAASTYTVLGSATRFA